MPERSIYDELRERGVSEPLAEYLTQGRPRPVVWAEIQRHLREGEPSEADARALTEYLRETMEEL